ncbi:MAG: magnesium transporter CorA family protein [Bacteroidota bacterium]
MSKSRFYHINRTGKLVPVATLTEALAARQKGGFVWLDYSQPTKEELSPLIDPFGLHPLSIEDCVDENQIPKVDEYPRNTFILFNAFTYSLGVLSIEEVDLFIGADFLVTVNSRGPENVQLLSAIERIVELNPEGARQGPAFLLHVILDHIVDQKFVAIETLEEELDRAEEAILSDLSEFNPATLLHLRRDLLGLRKSLFHEREILVKICRKDCPFIPEKMLFLYRDIYDHLTKFFELTEASRDIVTSLMEMYLSMLNNQMAHTSNQTNMTVRRLTFITTIFMPLTLLAGIGGMSEWSMMTGPGNWRIAYPAFLLVMVILGIISYHLLKRLEKNDRESDRPAIGRR